MVNRKKEKLRPQRGQCQLMLSDDFSELTFNYNTITARLRALEPGEVRL